MTPMKFHQTYAVVTDESAENGEAEETGFDWQDMPYTFKQLVHTLEFEYAGAEPSDYPSSNPRWITSYGERDMHDGSFRNISLHPANDRARRWWPQALKAAGITK
ncbi:hypothetical protein [Burkholderia territorii]|uniref:hypothetical protein n=1 Tax=Burkholderia territorii TaxID=1503055 RepID=UPI000755849A|nr:hypothetical protein [Burkholderia territorii]KWE37404.1 hypothetical protein WT49_11250 [Burkholderia territorii]KWE38444.1 hypothetical protein WT50_20105 [Burkholderia territorii]KWE40323.1 hypothetical protein WT51_28000 [Burkholderia territorii]